MPFETDSPNKPDLFHPCLGNVHYFIPVRCQSKTSFRHNKLSRVAKEKQQ